MAVAKTIQVGENTSTAITLSFPNHLDAPLNRVWVEFDGPAEVLRFQSLDHLDEWLTGVRHDTDVLLERRNRANQPTLGDVA